jgi:hypothetical protein
VKRVNPGKEIAMSFTNSGKHYLLIPAWILVLGLIAVGVIQSGNMAYYRDLAGFLYLLISGIALMLISFPVTEIGRAFLHAVKDPHDDVRIRNSIHFWEAAGRNFLIVGIIGSILHLMTFFNLAGHTRELLPSHAGEYSPFLQTIVNEMAEYLLNALYGVIMAVLCFIIHWRLARKTQTSHSTLASEQKAISTRLSGWGFSAAIGYALFFFILISRFLKFYMPVPFLIMFKPALFLVLGGAIALKLLMQGSDSTPALSVAFAVMGVIGFLAGAVQLQGHVAGAFAFILSSCLTALLGIALVSAPLEDRSIRTGRLAVPPTWSRVSWYVLPLLILILLLPILLVLFSPMARAQ